MHDTQLVRRLPAFLRATVAMFLAFLLAGQIAPASASTLGGVHVDTLSTMRGDVRSLTEVTLDWNVAVADARAPFVTTLTVAPADSQRFAPGDVLEATVETSSGSVHAARTDITDDRRSAVLHFGDTDIRLTDVANVALVITGAGRLADPLDGALHGTLDAFSGPLVDTATAASTEYRTTSDGGSAPTHQLFLHLPGASAAGVQGERVMVTLERADGAPVHVVREIGTPAQHTGAWARDSDVGTDAGTTIVVDVALEGVTSYDIALVRSQHWTRDASTPGIVARSMAVDLDDAAPGEGPGETPDPSEPGEPEDPVDPGEGEQPGGGEQPGNGETPGGGHPDGIVPVGLDPRLTYSEPNGPVSLNDPTKLQFCYSFQVTNVSAETVEWNVTFNTTLAPFWGLNPTIVQSGGIGALHQMSNGRTASYTETDGLWTIGGVDWNAKLQPGAGTAVHFCARADIPEADPTTFDTPQVSVDRSSNSYSVALRVSVTSSSRYFVPWETTVDLADHVCAATLPKEIRGENATLTHLEGTTYLVQGLDTAGTRFVSAAHPRDFVFMRYNPGGAQFLPGTCD